MGLFSPVFDAARNYFPSSRSTSGGTATVGGSTGTDSIGGVGTTTTTGSTDADKRDWSRSGRGDGMTPWRQGNRSHRMRRRSARG